MHYSWKVSFIKDHQIQVTYVVAHNEADAIMRATKEFGEVEIFEVFYI